MFVTKLKLSDNPKEKAGFFNRQTFFYLNDLFKLGASRPLVEEDLHEPSEPDRALTVCPRLEAAWENELRKADPSFGRAIWQANRLWACFHLSFQVFLLLIRLSLPILLGYFIDWFGDKDSVPLIYDRDLDGYIWAALYAALNLIYAKGFAISGIARESDHKFHLKFHGMYEQKLYGWFFGIDTNLNKKLIHKPFMKEKRESTSS